MQTAAILYPLALLLLLPLASGVLFYRLRCRARGRPEGWLRRLGWAAAAIGGGTLLTAGVLAVFIIRPDRCRAEPRGSLDEADSFAVFSFGLGAPVNGRPTAGESNRALARWLVEHNPARKPAVVQEPVYLALEELAAERPGLLDGNWVVRLPDPPGVYVDTMGAAYQAQAVLRLRGLHRPALVSHDLQLRRMAWSFEAVGVGEFVVPRVPPTPFDRDSVQHAGTRSDTAWLVRELFFARPVTLRPQATIVVVAAVAFLSGAALRLL